MKDISQYNWDIIIPKMASRARKKMIFWKKSVWRKRTRRFRCGDLKTRRQCQVEWQALIDQTLRNTLFEGSVTMDMPTSALITIRTIPQEEMNRRRRNRKARP